MCLPRRAGTGDGVALVDVNRLLGGEDVGERVVELLGRERDGVMGCWRGAVLPRQTLSVENGRARMPLIGSGSMATPATPRPRSSRQVGD